MTTPTIDDDLAALSAAPVKFEQMNEIQRRLHNAAIVLGADGDEYGFEQLQRDAIAEISRLIAALREAQAEAKRERDWHSRVLASAQKLFGVDCIRLKLSLFGNGRARNIFPDDMDGAWVALQRAEDDGHMGLVSMLEEARARADEAREDAERYRWLTDDHGSSEARMNVFTVSESIPIRGKGATDAAIDAAMVRAARAATKGAA